MNKKTERLVLLAIVAVIGVLVARYAIPFFYFVSLGGGTEGP